MKKVISVVLIILAVVYTLIPVDLLPGLLLDDLIVDTLIGLVIAIMGKNSSEYRRQRSSTVIRNTKTGNSKVDAVLKAGQAVERVHAINKDMETCVENKELAIKKKADN